MQLLARFLGPVFALEMLRTTRRKQFFVLRALFACSLLWLFMNVWENHRFIRAFDELPKFAGELFVGVLCIQYAAIVLLTPMLFAGAVAGERERDTLDVLLNTTQSDAHILWGKSASRLAVLLLVNLTVLPVLSLVGLLGGVDYNLLWLTVPAVLQVLLVLASLSLYFSASARTTLDALLRTYFWFTLWTIAIPGGVASMAAHWFDPAMTQAVGRVAATTIMLSTPFGLFMSSMVVEFRQDALSVLGYWVYAVNLLVWLTVSLVLGLAAKHRLRRPPYAEVKRAKLSRLRNWLASRRMRTAEKRRRRAPLFLGRWPVENPLWLRARIAPAFDREGNTGRMQRVIGALALLTLAAIGLIKPNLLTKSYSSRTASMFIGFGWLAVAVTIAMVAATSFVRDRTRGLLDLMLATPMTAQEFVDGMLLGIAERVRGAVLLALFFVLFFSTNAYLPGFKPLPESYRQKREENKLLLDQHALEFGTVPVAAAVVSTGTALLFGAVLAMLGVHCSLPDRSVAAAMISTTCWGVLASFVILFLAVPLGFWMLIVAPLLVWAALKWSRVQRTSVSLGARFFSVYYFLALMLTCWSGLKPSSRVFPAIATLAPYYVVNPLDARWDWYMGFGAWEVAVLCYWTAMIIALTWGRRYLINHFDDICGRTSSFRPPSAEPEP